MVDNKTLDLSTVKIKRNNGKTYTIQFILDMNGFMDNFIITVFNEQKSKREDISFIKKQYVNE